MDPAAILLESAQNLGELGKCNVYFMYLWFLSDILAVKR